MAIDRIFKDEASEEKGERARMASFIGAIAIADLVKTTLGPKGMDKILQSTGRGRVVTVTNDGATILKSLHIDNPAAKVLVDISKVQDDEVGDGTTSVVVLAGELLREAEKLVAAKIHPMTIISDRQTLYWSATWPKEVEQLARQFLYNPYKVIIGSSDLKANHAIHQHVDIVSENQKYNKLVKLLEDIMDGSRILIFMDTKKGCDQITRQLRMDGWPALSIHGDKSQAERDWVLSEFKAGKSPIMTATDVAARGLDVKDVKYVINYDFPGSLEDYVHRIGRTGRAGAKGTAYTFFTAANARFAKELISILKEAGQKVSPELAAMGSGAPPPTGHGGFRDHVRGYGGGRSWS